VLAVLDLDKVELPVLEVAVAETELAVLEADEDPDKVELAVPEADEDPDKAELAVPEADEDPDKVELAVPEADEDPDKVELALLETDEDLLIGHAAPSRFELPAQGVQSSLPINFDCVQT
jgi:hypothetical protein